MKEEKIRITEVQSKKKKSTTGMSPYKSFFGDGGKEGKKIIHRRNQASKEEPRYRKDLGVQGKDRKAGR